ncbi:unnamed protein product [Closterium sp. NIES-65]|nr:unnamed protein product [Closterium sp. NIES-65]CAI5966175.1 unnamed protein product [Closterium sp. NIES-65]
MDDLKCGTAAVNPHVVDGGGAGMRTADPMMTIPRVGDLPATQDPNAPSTMNDTTGHPLGGRAAEEAVSAEEDCEDGLDVTNEYLNEDDE